MFASLLTPLVSVGTLSSCFVGAPTLFLSSPMTIPSERPSVCLSCHYLQKGLAQLPPFFPDLIPALPENTLEIFCIDFPVAHFTTLPGYLNSFSCPSLKRQIPLTFRFGSHDFA